MALTRNFKQTVIERGQQKDIDQAKALHAEYKERKKILVAEKKGRR